MIGLATHTLGSGLETGVKTLAHGEVLAEGEALMVTRTIHTGSFAIVLFSLALACGGGNGSKVVLSGQTQSPAAAPVGTLPNHPSTTQFTSTLAVDVLYSVLSPDQNTGPEHLGGFGLDGSGVLTPLFGLPQATQGDGRQLSGPTGFVAMPGNRFVVVGHNGSSSLESFAVQPNGSVTPAAILPLTVDPANISVHPSANVIYVTLGRSGDLAVVHVDPSTGVLTEVPGSPFQVGLEARDSAVSPNGLFLATGHMFDQDRGLRLHLLDLQGYPQLPAVGSISLSGRPGANVAFTPNGQFVLVQNLDDGIHVLSVNSQSGALAELASSPTAIGAFANGMLLHPSGKAVYVLTPFVPSTLHTYGLNAQGALALMGATHSFSAQGISAWALAPSGKWLYAADSVSGALMGFEVSPVTKALTPVAGGANALYGVTPQVVPTALLVLEK